MVSATVATCLNKRQTLPGLLGLTAIVLAGFEVELELSKYYEFPQKIYLDKITRSSKSGDQLELIKM